MSRAFVLPKKQAHLGVFNLWWDSLDMGVTQIIVCSKIKGLVSEIQECLGQFGLDNERYSFLQCLPEDLEKNGKHESDWRQANIIVADPGLVVDLLMTADNLKWFSSTWAGVNVITNCPREKNFTLTRLSGCFGELMSEYVFGHILGIERNLFAGRNNQPKKLWKPETFYPVGEKTRPRKLSTLTLGLLGCGDIGSAVAKTAKDGFGMKVVVYKRSKASNSNPYVDAIVTLEELLSESDYIVNTLPSTKSTIGLLNDEVFRKVSVQQKVGKQGPVFINVGRGDIIEENCLLSALGESISGPNLFTAAVLDVFENEPLRKDSPLWVHPRVIITPHISAPSLCEDVARLFVSNLYKYSKGEPMQYVVDWERAY